MIYFIQSLADNPQCTIRVGYRSAVCSNGYAELDPEKDVNIIREYKAVEAPKPDKSAKKIATKTTKEAGE
jgi:hypothetical protein